MIASIPHMTYDRYTYIYKARCWLVIKEHLLQPFGLSNSVMCMTERSLIHNLDYCQLIFHKSGKTAQNSQACHIDNPQRIRQSSLLQIRRKLNHLYRSIIFKGKTGISLYTVRTMKIDDSY
jgi:hypothetical protein